MISFLGRGYRHRLSSKLRFINAITGLAFLLLCAGIAAAFIAIKNESIDVMQQDMGRVVANSDLTRALSELFSDIHLLSDTFYRSSHLDSEGTRLSAVLDGISQGVRDPQLETRLTELAGQFQSFLAQCARVNDLLHAEDDVFGNVERELTDLENLISKLLVDATLKGEDTSFVTQQLTLAIGFRESLLSIAKLNAELDLGTRTSTSTDRDSPILAAIDDLALRLQTISASAPEVAHHGRLIEGGIQDLRKSVSGFFVEIEKLNGTLRALDTAESYVLSHIEQIDKEIATTAQVTAEAVEKIFLLFSFAIVALIVIVIVAIHVTTTKIIKFNINDPMQTILRGIEAFSNGKLDQKIALSRVDEWDTIEKSLNIMAADLLASRTELESANTELEARVQERTAELARTVSELWRSESSLLEAQRVAHLGHWSWHLENSELDWSEELLRIFGLAPAKTEPSYEVFVDLIHPEDRERVEAILSGALEGNHSFATDYRIIRGDGEERWVECQGRVVEDEQGRQFKVSGTLLDITERKRIESLLIEEKERALVTLKSIGDAVISTDAQGHVEYLNPVAENLTGYSADEAKGQSLDQVFNIINEETREKAEDPVTRCLAEGKVVGLANHTVLLSRSGVEYAIEDSAAPIFARDGSVLGVVLVFKDVTAARQLSQQISYQATHDTLTGLINRCEFERRLRRVLDTAQGECTENALFYLDLDQFKLVNDTGGHAAGDELLRQLGQLLQQHIRKRDTLARLGGDEFGLLMEHCSIEEAQRVGEKIIDAVGTFSLPWEEHTFSVGVSMGLVAVNDESKSIQDLLSDSDTACYIAKEHGRNRVHLHQDDDEERVKRHGEMQWAVRLPRALSEGRFQLYFQNIVPVVGAGAGRNRHYEILLRMEDEQGNLILPGVFLPAAERYSLSDRIDRWVIGQVLSWFRDHPSQLDQLGICSINLSGLSLSNETFLPFVIQELKSTGVPPQKICFEITETVAIANLASATTLIKALRKLGCCFALDDFGSGLSSFAYLKSLQTDFLKIDGVFVKDILDDPMDLAMVRSINEIGHVTGKKTIAEFVENEAILEKLREIGVDYAQGYGIGRPRPLDELLEPEPVANVR